MFDTPILFIVFKREDTARQVFEKIKMVKPKKLFISADGPRLDVDGEEEACTRVREIFKEIDWDCEVHTKFNDENSGLKKTISSAIDWFFENVEEGIILEDDCLPDLSFFSFCEQMLERYRQDTRIMHISGNNFVKSKKIENKDYYFSKVAQIWGWATWKRAWKFFDVNMTNYQTFRDTNQIDNIFDGYFTKKYMIKHYDKITAKDSFSWSWYWIYTVFSNNGLCITPSVNLVSNIGFGSDAVHATNEKNKLANAATQNIHAEIVHPDFVLPNKKIDNEILNYRYDFGLRARITREIRRMLKLH
jgi:hypothetical protein